MPSSEPLFPVVKSYLLGFSLAFLVVAILIASVFFAPSCLAPGPDGSGGGIDWERAALEAALSADDLRDTAALVDEETGEVLIAIADALEVIATGIEAGIDSASTIEAIEAALALTEGFIEELPEGSQDEARVVVILVRAGLRRASAYAAAELPEAPIELEPLPAPAEER